MARTKPPCKLLSHLMEHPSADLTQIPLMPAVDEPLHFGGRKVEGVECGKAYEMLIRFATSEKKTDDIALVLGKGCTQDSRGGCAVKRQVVWQVLDEMCG
jgi:hypothetical protein